MKSQLVNSLELGGVTFSCTLFAGESIVLGSIVGDIIILEKENGAFKAKKRAGIHCMAVTSLSCARINDQYHILSASQDGTIKLSVPNLHGLDVVREINLDNDIVVCPQCLISDDGSTIVIGDVHGFIFVQKSGENYTFRLGSEEKGRDKVSCLGLCFSGAEQNVCVFISKESIYTVDLDKIDHSIYTRKLSYGARELKRHIRCVSYDHKNDIYVFGTYTNLIEFWKLDPEPVSLFEIVIPAERNNFSKLIECIKFSADGRFVFASTSNGLFIIIDVEKKKIIDTNRDQRGRIISFSINSESTEACVVSDENTTNILKLE